MPVSLSDLIAQREALERQIQATREQAKGNAVAEVRKLMTEHGLTAADLIAKSPSRANAVSGKKVAAKYRDPATSSTWTGRGLKPKWLAAAIANGKALDDFAI